MRTKLTDSDKKRLDKLVVKNFREILASYEAIGLGVGLECATVRIDIKEIDFSFEITVGAYEYGHHTVVEGADAKTN